MTELFRDANAGAADNDRQEAGMRKVIANEWMTLDGVVQAPGYADEDVTGGFRHGGWHTRYLDDLSMNWVIENEDKQTAAFEAKKRSIEQRMKAA